MLPVSNALLQRVLNNNHEGEVQHHHHITYMFDISRIHHR